MVSMAHDMTVSRCYVCVVRHPGQILCWIIKPYFNVRIWGSDQQESCGEFDKLSSSIDHNSIRLTEHEL